MSKRERISLPIPPNKKSVAAFFFPFSCIFSWLETAKQNKNRKKGYFLLLSAHSCVAMCVCVCLLLNFRRFPWYFFCFYYYCRRLGPTALLASQLASRAFSIFKLTFIMRCCHRCRCLRCLFYYFSFILFECVCVCFVYSTLFLYLSPCVGVGIGIGVDWGRGSAALPRFFSLFWFLI